VKVLVTAAAFSVALAIGSSGCFLYQHAQAEQHDLNRATYTVTPGQLLLQNDDTDTWIDVKIALKTDHGQYLGATDDIAPGKIRGMDFKSFKDPNGKSLTGEFLIDIVKVDAKYSNQQPFTAVAYPR
jgi:hypothetical protein